MSFNYNTKIQLFFDMTKYFNNYFSKIFNYFLDGWLSDCYEKKKNNYFFFYFEIKKERILLLSFDMSDMKFFTIWTAIYI